MNISEQARNVEVRIATRMIRQDAEGFIDSMTHIVDYHDKPLCGVKAKINLIDDPFPLGQIAQRDEITAGEDDRSFACHRCLGAADSRIRKGWKPV